MKGILLAGGNGSRLAPLTNVVNKHLLPVYDKPMVLYPLQKLKDAGLKDIMLITGGEHLGRFAEFLGDGSKYDVNFTYRSQEKASGIAGAFSLCQDFAKGEDVSVVLGDNIFSKKFIPKKSKYGCTVFLKEVSETEARRFGCAVVKGDKVTNVEEKPKNPKSLLAITGYYMFSKDALEIVKKLKPSSRGELEITDVINTYVKKGDCGFRMVEGEWYDAGTFDSLLKSNNFAYEENKIV